MISSVIALDKKQLRRDIRHARRALSASFRKQAALKILHSLRQSKFFQYSQHIAIYLTNDGEIDTSVLIQDLRRRGKTLYLPVVQPLNTGRLSFVRWQAKTHLQRNRFNIAEPAFSRQHSITPALLDLICMPLVAFDEQGNRLGMGGGFYDRTLAAMSKHKQPALIGLAYELQKMPSLPLEPWDLPLDAVATEKKLYIFSSKNSHI